MAAPLLITVYTRIEHLKNCIDSLLTNEMAADTDLYIASDAASKPEHEEIVKRIREYIVGIRGFKSVNLFAWDSNLGSALSIKTARLSIYESHDRQIFMEDDNVVSPHFLKFMNESLDRYKDYKDVFAVCGFNVNVSIPSDYRFDAYFMNFISANGWATWREKYFEFLEHYQLPDFKSKEFKEYSKYLEKSANNLKRMAKQGASWGDTKISHYMYSNKMVCILPCKSLVYNTGWDGSGEHCGKDYLYTSMKINNSDPVQNFPTDTVINPKWQKNIQQFSKYPFLGKLKTAFYDWRVEQRKIQSSKRSIF